MADEEIAQDSKKFKELFKSVFGNLRKVKPNRDKLEAINEKIARARSFLQTKRNRYIALGALVAIFFIVLALFIFFSRTEPLSVIYQPRQTIESRFSADGTKFESAKEVEFMIQKASFLYSRGQINEALDIYKNISLLSQSVANFNLGVAKMRENSQSEALGAFDNVIKSGDNVAAGAINAAILAYQLGDSKKYEYYVNLAKGTELEWLRKPLYFYLHSLINYYSGEYFHMFSSLKNPPESYNRDNSALLAKNYILFNDDYSALKTLLSNPDSNNEYAVALLYARMGEYDLAAESLDSYLRNNDLGDKQALLAQALIELKRSKFGSASMIYEGLLDKHEARDLSDIYPIKIVLNDLLFDVDSVQRYFWDRTIEENRILSYKILFYYAPFRVFDAGEVENLIRENGLNLRMNNIEESANSLARGAMLTKINEEIARALGELNNHNIYRALEIIQSASVEYPNHQALQYNLGLIYAQLNDFDNAKKHFLKAFHLSNDDAMSGIFALICAQLTHSSSDRILNEVVSILENISSDKEPFLRSLLGFVNGNIYDEMPWYQNAQKTAMMSALNALYSLDTRNKSTIISAFNELREISNNDIVARILARLLVHYQDNIKSFSLDLFDFFKTELNNLEVIYFGPNLAREVYIYFAFLIGANSYVDEVLRDRIINSQGDISGILQALALNCIYLKKFEQAFVYYNTLIDDYNLKTSENYFLASVAAIGAGHYDSAVALLQLSRIESGANLESRFALGLLHLANENYKLASLQFVQIGDVEFKSSYFDFAIDTSEILKAGN